MRLDGAFGRRFRPWLRVRLAWLGKPSRDGLLDCQGLRRGGARCVAGDRDDVTNLQSLAALSGPFWRAPGGPPEMIARAGWAGAVSLAAGRLIVT